MCAEEIACPIGRSLEDPGTWRRWWRDLGQLFRRPRGLGDVVHMAAVATGVDAVVRYVNPNCGCDRRRARLNQLVPFTRSGE